MPVFSLFRPAGTVFALYVVRARTTKQETIMYMPVTDHEKSEWSRMAQAAYSAGRNDIGHRYSGAASLPRGVEIALTTFDKLQDGYRAWLVFDEFPEKE